MPESAETRNIVLIGLPGSGKTTLGRMLARELDRPFLDLDQWIVEKAGMPVKKLFAGYGEDFFRQVEAEAVARAMEEGGKVIATGGGVVLSPRNVERLRAGLVIFLDRAPDDIAGDIATGHRPLLREGVAALYRLAEDRRERYQTAAHLVFANKAPLKEAAKRLEVLCRAALEGPGYAVIGDPIGHSLSPPIHAAAFGARNVPMGYVAVHVPRGMAPEFLAGALQSELKGFNATIPHKRELLPHLEGISREASLCGAVNTVAIREGKPYGHNTDMEGLLLALRRRGLEYRDRRVLILGAGGAAVGIAAKAALEGAASIAVLGRRVEKAREIGGVVAQARPTPFTAGPLDSPGLERAAAQADLLLNATPLGMAGIEQDFPSLDFLEALPGDAAVCDLIYNPPETGLLRRARALGLTALNGLAMLIYQAILAQEFFAGEELDRELLYARIAEALAQRGETA